MASTSSQEILPSGFRRADLVRLLTQCINTLGYDRAATALQDESGIPLLSTAMAEFQAGVLEGRWDAIVGNIDTLGISSVSCRTAAHALILRQKYLELLEAGRLEEALHCLRSQLAPLYLQHGQHEALPGATVQPPALETSSDALASLSGLLMCQGAEELKARCGWEGSERGSREALLRELSRHIPPSLLLPEDRLQMLLQQAILWQQTSGVEHAAATMRSGGGAAAGLDLSFGAGLGRSLLEDPASAHVAVPDTTRHVLERHTDEVRSTRPPTVTLREHHSSCLPLLTPSRRITPSGPCTHRCGSSPSLIRAPSLPPPRKTRWSSCGKSPRRATCSKCASRPHP